MRLSTIASLLTILLIIPLVGHSATVEGTIYKALPVGSVMDNVQVCLLDASGWWLDKCDDDDIITAGVYHISDVDEGDYTIQVRPNLYSSDDMYAIQFLSVNVGADPNIFDFTMEIGGNISGTVTPEVAPIGDWWDINVEIWNDQDQYVTDGWLQDSSGNYRTTAVPPGTYYIMFKDQNNQYQEEWYGNYPTSWYIFDTVPVTITTNNTTTGIDASLHEVEDSGSRYFIGWHGVSTIHFRDNFTNSTSTNAYVDFEAYHFTRVPVSPDEISSWSVTPPSGSCNNPWLGLTARWEQQFRDRNTNGTIDGDDERDDPKGTYFPNANCELDAAPHPSGQYQLQVNIVNGPSLNKTLTTPTPWQMAQLTPVAGLTASWDDTENELNLSWMLPASYPPDTTIEIRVEPYNNGQYKNVRLRARNLPANLTAFTFDSSMTTSFNHGRNDQIRVEVRIRGTNNTTAVTRQGYDFDSEAGTLTPAKIDERPYDINNDGRTGLEETIHILKVLTEQ